MFAFVSTVTTVSNDPVSNGGSILVVIINFSTPLSPSCEEGVLNPLPSPRPFQKSKGCNRYAIRLAGHQSPRQVSYAEWDRLAESGASEVSPGCAGWDRMTIGLFHHQFRCFTCKITTNNPLRCPTELHR